MTTAVLGPSAPADRRHRPLGALDRPSQLLEHITPNWFASVMGTGIVATAATTLPLNVVGLRAFATGVWMLASLALVALSIAFVAHWLLHRSAARRYANHPTVSLFYGAPPMALMTVGAGTLVLGKDVIGDSSALIVASALWTAGTVLGLATCVWIPYRMMKAGNHSSAPLPAWLMPVVPPMVSATTGALLLPHIGATDLRVAFLVCCYALFAVGLFAGGIILALVCRHLRAGGRPPLQAIPTVWITLGLVGQSITAANLLAADAGSLFAGEDAGIASGLHDFGIVYGVSAGTFGVIMFVAATLLTLRAARAGLTFSLTWWSFTFPVGTCVTGAAALGTALGWGALHVLAVFLYALLVGAWIVVATRTAHGSISGRIFLP
nr:TDT family transporter [Rhodococcus sp. (in: high G+C Gram-positive bacteria)]